MVPAAEPPVSKATPQRIKGSCSVIGRIEDANKVPAATESGVAMVSSKLSTNGSQLLLQVLAVADISGLFFFLSKTAFIDIKINPENRLNTTRYCIAANALRFYLKFL